MTTETETDIAFSLFLATITPADLSDYEWRLYRHIQLTNGRKL